MKSDDFQAVYRELYPSLSRYVHRFTGDTDAAADIVQDSFLRLLEHDLPRDEVRPWIFVVATNLARDRVRKRERRRRLLVANQEKTVAASSHSKISSGPSGSSWFERRWSVCRRETARCC